MKNKLQARLKAFFTHLILSAFVIGLFLLVVYFIWYPGPYYIIHSTFDVVKILVGVDLVLGPLLTLLLFDIGKSSKELTLDISLVVLVQISALLWGMHVTYTMRPLAAAYYGRDFYTITGRDLGESNSNYPILPKFYEKPKLVYVKPIQDQQERLRNYTQVLNAEVKSQVFRPEYYVDIADYYDRVIKNSKPDAVVGHPDKVPGLTRFLEQHGGTVNDYCYSVVMNADYVGTLILDCRSPKILGIISGYP